MLVVPPPSGEVAARHPGCGTVAGRSQLAEAGLACGEGLLGLVKPALLEQSPAEHELCIAGLVDVVDPSVEQFQCVASLLLGLLEVACPEMNLRERGDGSTRVGVLAGLQRDRERLLEQLD